MQSSCLLARSWNLAKRWRLGESSDNLRDAALLACTPRTFLRQELLPLHSVLSQDVWRGRRRPGPPRRFWQMIAYNCQFSHTGCAVWPFVELRIWAWNRYLVPSRSRYDCAQYRRSSSRKSGRARLRLHRCLEAYLKAGLGVKWIDREVGIRPICFCQKIY